MRRAVAVLDAPSSIGLRPHHETGAPQEVNRGPGVLRELGVIERLNATDLGEVLPPRYQDFTRPPGKARNEAGVASYSRSLSKRIAEGLEDDRFVVVLGGDCSIVLGCLLGARNARGIGRRPEPGRTGVRRRACRLREPRGVDDRIGGEHGAGARGRAR